MADHHNSGDPFAEGRRYPDVVEQAGSWQITLTWEVVDGRIECRGVNLKAVGPGATVNAGLWDDLRMGERIRRHRSAMTTEALATLPPKSRAGIRLSTWERWAEAARVYQQAMADDRPPTKAVAERFGLTVGGASTLVSRAREHGLLPPTSPGAPQG